MKDKKIQEALEDIAKDISLSQLAKRVGKDRTWLYHKMRNDVVNGVQYCFSADECELLALELDGIAERIKQSADIIRKVAQSENRSKGRYYTNYNVFEYPLFQEWIANIPNIEETTILEPFAGECSIPKMLPNYKWRCYDVEPHKCDYKVVKRNTIHNFPNGYRVCITNPPYLARNSATRRRLKFPQCGYDNLYKHCLQLMLDNCQYVAAIVPDSYIQSGLFTERLYGVVSIPEKVFVDTEFPVCLALFNPTPTSDFQIWNGSDCLGSFKELSIHNLNQYRDEVWRFNDIEGEVGVSCLDGKKDRIKFTKGTEVSAEIKGSSRSFARISGLPNDVNCDAFIEVCNEILERYRTETKDVFLTSTKGLRYDGNYRKRISFSVVRSILTYAISLMTQTKSIKALILDFDYTLFDTSADNEVRKNSKTKDWDIIYSKIPEYKLYDGWREVFEVLKNKNIKIAIISTAKRELIEKTLKFFGLSCDVIIGWQLYYQKPHPHLVQMALNKLQVSNEEVISIGDLLVDKEMSQNGGVRFIGATWDSSEATVLTSGETISKPMEILRFLDV